MTHNFTATETTYWIAHEIGSLTDGVLEPGESVSTGLDYFETYTSGLTQSQRLGALKSNYEVAAAQWRETLRLQDPVAHLADYRWQKETGGLTLTTGPRIRTDRISQSQMTSTLTALAEQMVPEPVQWKAESGWVSMTRVQLKAAATEVANHVSKCFQAEEMVALDIEEDPTIDVEAAFDAAYAAL